MARTIPDLPRLGQPAGLPTPNSSNSFWHSEPSKLLLGHRSTRDLPATADVVIIGSGITGASIARHLLKRDGSASDGTSRPNVVMLEAREACWGATGRVSTQKAHFRTKPKKQPKSNTARTAATANQSSSNTRTIPQSGTSSWPTTTPSPAKSKLPTSTANG
jgi:choline dehydrogenase-like flavoprotein